MRSLPVTCKVELPLRGSALFGVLFHNDALLGNHSHGGALLDRSAFILACYNFLPHACQS